MSRISLVEKIRAEPRKWLITGVAGFIGSNLLEALLSMDQAVVGLDNYATGHRRNLEQVRLVASDQQWSRFQFIEGDIHELQTCQVACSGVDYVLHQAALGSVPRSIDDPAGTNRANVTGFLNMLLAARDAGVRRFVYAASSSTYGDNANLPKIEDQIGKPLSPYAVTKYVNELYADIFSRCYDFHSIGLRYFNIFGPRQDPDGPYAAVIPKWIAGLIAGEQVFVNGDGETSRDFCFVENAVQANLLAATVEAGEALGTVYNIAVQERTTLNELFCMIRDRLLAMGLKLTRMKPQYRDFRPGDVRHSLADISKARRLLGYEPTYNVEQGLESAMAWYVANLAEADRATHKEQG